MQLCILAPDGFALGFMSSFPTCVVFNFIRNRLNNWLTCDLERTDPYGHFVLTAVMTRQ